MFQTWIKPQKYFSQLDVILNSKRQKIGLIMYFLLKSHALIKLGLFRFKTCPKKVTQLKFLAISNFLIKNNKNKIN
jgi:hypothetical protein